MKFTHVTFLKTVSCYQTHMLGQYNTITLIKSLHFCTWRSWRWSDIAATVDKIFSKLWTRPYCSQLHCT